MEIHIWCKIHSNPLMPNTKKTVKQLAINQQDSLLFYLEGF